MNRKLAVLQTFYHGVLPTSEFIVSECKEVESEIIFLLVHMGIAFYRGDTITPCSN